MQISQLKSDCRKAAFEARKIAHGADLDGNANMQLMSFLKMQTPNAIVASYMPIRTEVSPLPAMHKMAARGMRFCVPVVIAAGSPLEFHRWTPDTEMIEGAYGAAIPAESDPMLPDIVITPLAAFDLGGYRLGYGGGFYDRSFEELSEIKKVEAIGFAYSDQEVMMVPREDTDYPLDAIITERGILSF